MFCRPQNENLILREKTPGFFGLLANCFPSLPPDCGRSVCIEIFLIKIFETVTGGDRLDLEYFLMIRDYRALGRGQRLAGVSTPRRRQSLNHYPPLPPQPPLPGRLDILVYRG